MNNQRRKAIQAIIDQIDELRGQFANIAGQIEEVRHEEQECFDNLPESFQNGERGETIQSAIDALDNAYGEIDCVDLYAIVSALEEARS